MASQLAQPPLRVLHWSRAACRTIHAVMVPGGLAVAVMVPPGIAVAVASCAT